MPLELTITNEEEIEVTLKPVSSTGKPAKTDGLPTWTIQIGESTNTVSGDGMTGTLRSSDTPGDTVYVVEADVDLGAGVETIADTITLHVAGAKASSLGLVAGNPRPKS